MAKTIQASVKTGNNDTNQQVQVIQGSGDQGQPARLKAVKGAHYEFKDLSSQDAAPVSVHSKRVGKHLHLMLEGSVDADLIVEDYYVVNPAPEDQTGISPWAMASGAAAALLGAGGGGAGGTAALAAVSVATGADATTATSSASSTNSTTTTATFASVFSVQTKNVLLASVDAPAVSILTDANNDGFVNAKELNKRPTLVVNVSFDSGKVQVGDSVTVSNGTLTKKIVLVQDDLDNGFVRTTFAKPAEGGVMTVTAALKTAANGDSAQATDSIKLDTTPPNGGVAPGVVFMNDKNMDGIVNSSEFKGEDTFVVKATFDKTTVFAGDKVIFTDASNTSRTTTVDITQSDINNGFVLSSFFTPKEGDVLSVQAVVCDKAGNLGVKGFGNVKLDAAGPTTTISINGISLDSGVADFITNDKDGLTVNAALSAELKAGETLWYSNNNGATWVNITSDVVGKAVWHVDTKLTSSMTVKMRVGDSVNNFGQAASQFITIDPTAPGQKEDGTDAAVSKPVVAIAEATNGVSKAELADGIQSEVTLPTGTVAGDKITLTVTDPSGDKRTVDYTVTAEDVAAGKANVTIPTTQVAEDGNYNITAVVTDIANNASKPSDAISFKLDTTAPGQKEDGTDAAVSKPVVAIAEAVNGVSKAELADGIQSEVTLPTGTVAGDKITLTVTDPSGDKRTVDYTVTAEDVAAGKANVTVPASQVSEDGNYSVSAVVTDIANNSSKPSDAISFKLDTTAPGDNENGSQGAIAKPVVAIAEATNGVSKAELADGIQSEVTLPTGTVAGDKITLTVTDPSGDKRTVDYTVTAEDVAAGKANVTIPTTQVAEDGNYNITAVVTDIANNSSKPSDAISFKLDTTAPGQKEDGTDAAVSKPVVAIAEATNGVSKAELADGIQSEVTLPTGTVAGDKITLTVTDPSGDKRTVDYTVTAEDVAAGKANVTVPASQVSEDGNYSVSAVVTDIANNSSKPSEAISFKLDTTAPGQKEDGTDAAVSKPVVAIAEATNGVSKAELADGIQSEVTLPTGTVAGDKITLTVTDPSGDKRTVDYTVTAEDVAAGKANVTVPASQVSEDGNYSVSAVVTDIANNSSKPSDAISFKLDTTAPGDNENDSQGAIAKPVVAIAEATNGVSKAELADGIQSEVTLPTGTVAGDKITLTVTDPSGDKRTVDYTVTAEDVAAGKANVTIPTTQVAEDGNYNITAVVTDIANNSSKPSDAISFKLDTTAPGQKEDGTDAAVSKPVVAIAEATNGVSKAELADGIQSEVTLPTGTVAGDKITLTVTDPSGDKRTVDYTVTAEDVAAGKANVTVPASQVSEDGNYSVSAVVTDIANNSSKPSDAISFKLDTTAPGDNENGSQGAIAKPVVAIAEATNGVSKAELADGIQSEVTLPTGTVAGDKITLTVTDPSGDKRTVDYTVTAEDVAAGKANVTIPTTQVAEDGNYNITAVVTDIANNSSKPSEAISFKLDTAGPSPVVFPEDPLNPPAGKTSLVLDAVTADNVVNIEEAAGKVMVTGTARGEFTAGDEVTLTIKGNTYKGNLDSNGKFAIEVPGSDLVADSDVTINATLVAHDQASNTGTITATKAYSVDTTASTTTVSITAISNDTGVAGDFVTSDNDGLTITAKLSTALATGETLWYSNDNGVTWNNITADVNGTGVTHVDAALTSTSTVKMRVGDAANNFGAVASQLITIDATTANGGKAPTVEITTDTNNDAVVDKDELGASTTFTVKGTFDKANVKVGDKFIFTNGTTEQSVTLTSGNIADGFVTTAFAKPAEGATLTVSGKVQTLAGTDSPVSQSDSARLNVVNNTKATVDITSIDDAATGSQDTGFSATDFITKDRTLTFKGTVTGFNEGGTDKVKLELVAPDGFTVYQLGTVTPVNGAWKMVDPLASFGGARVDGSYTLIATIVDKDGKVLNATAPVSGTNGGSDSQVIVVDNAASNGGNAPVVTITTDSDDDGFVSSDELKGSTSFAVQVDFDGDKVAAGDKVLVTAGSVTQTLTLSERNVLDGFAYATFDKPAEGASLTVSAKIEDLAGNLTAVSDIDTAVLDTTPPNGGNAPTVEITTDANNDGIINKDELGGGTVVNVKASFNKTLVAEGDTVDFMSGTVLKSVTLTLADINNGFVTSFFNAPAENGTLLVTAKLKDHIGNATLVGSDSIKLDATAPTTTVTLNSISVDSGAADFNTTDNNGLTLNATLSSALVSGEKLWYSNNNGVSWTDITAVVSGTTVTYVDAALTSTSTVSMRVGDEVNNYGTAATQLIVIDTTAPEFVSLAAASVNENVAAGTSVYKAVATDVNAVRYSLENSGDAAKFSINATTGVVSITEMPDYESKSSYSFTVVATDPAGNANKKVVTLAVNNVNDAPVVNATTVVDMTPQIEDAAVPVNGDATAGTWVSSLFGAISDVDVAPLKGIAITAITGAGTLYYSINNGTNWIAINNADLGSGALLLDGNSRVFFKHNTPNWNGYYDNVLWYRGWDQTNLSATVKVGDKVDVGKTGDGSGLNGGGSAFSAGMGKIGLTATAVNDAPVLANSSTLSYTENNAATVINKIITVADVDNAALASATVKITSGYVSGQDVLSFTNDGTSMGNIAAAVSGDTVTLTSSGGTATLAEWQAALRAVAYSNTSDAPSTTARTVSYVINDGALNSTAVTSTINVTAVNDAPMNTVPGAQTAKSGIGKAISGLSISDIDAGSSDMTVTLAVDHGTITLASGSGVSVVSNGTASVTLTGSLSAINTLLGTTNAVVYTATSGYAGADKITVTTLDNGNVGTGGTLTDVDYVNITVAIPNNAPVLADTSLSFAAVLQGTTVSAPSGSSAGVLVSSLLGGATDSDGNSKGMAITGVDTTNGALYYSTNSGSTWTKVTALLSESNALLIGGDSTQRIAYVPNTGSGYATNAITFHAWDQTSGTQGSLVNLTTLGTGGTTAFSAATDTVSQTVTTTSIALTNSINGEASGDHSGAVISNAGDVNGDGYDDFLIGAPHVTLNGNLYTGKTYVVFGGANDVMPLNLSSLTAGTNAAGFVINGATGNNSGASVSAAGDLNGDGLADIFVGAPRNGAGASYVVYGKASTTAVELSSLGAGGVVINGQYSGDQAGSYVSSVGDINGDGIADLLMGANAADPSSGNNAGRVFVAFGSTANTTINMANLASGIGGFVIDGPAANEQLVSTSNVGDFNGDGLADILVSASLANNATGSTYLVFGKSTGTAVSTASLGTYGLSITGEASGNYAGSSISNAGDVNGDGLADLIIGAPSADMSSAAPAYDEGRAYVVFGTTSTASINLANIKAGVRGFAIQSRAISESLGSSVSYAGDINGDGLADVLVHAYKANSWAGRTYVVYGKTGGAVVEASNLMAGNGGFVINGQAASDSYNANWSTATNVSYAGDVNGDGYDDLLVSALLADPVVGGSTATDAGKTYVIYGGPQYSTGTVALGTGTAADENVVGTSGNDTLVGNGGVDRFNAGKGNDTIVLTASDVSNLASNVVGNVKAMVDGGTGYDSLQVSASGVNLDLTAISNAGAMTNEGTSRINSIERINLGADATANTLTLTEKDVNDMAGFDSVHTSTTSVDGRVWTNVSGSALSAVTKFHQVVVDGTSADTMNLYGTTGTWSNVGKASNGVLTYNVYQNTATNSQVIVDETVKVNLTPVALVSINAANTDLAQTDFFSGASTAPVSATPTTVSTALWDVYDPLQVGWIYDNTPGNTNWILQGGALDLGPNRKSGPYTKTFTLKNNVTFSSISYLTAYGDASQAASSPIVLNFYDANNVKVASTSYVLGNVASFHGTYNFSYSFSGQATHFDMTTDGYNAFAIDDLGYTSTTGVTTSEFGSGGATTDTTPLLKGSIARNLVAGETVEIWRDGVFVSNATTSVGSSAWTWTDPSASLGAHSYVAKLKNGSFVLGSSSAFTLSVVATPLVLDLNGDGVQTTTAEQGTTFDLLSSGAKQHVAWIDKHDGLLAMDLNGDGQINDGSELFGNHTKLADGSTARDGWSALAAQDTNGDGIIDAKDARFDKLLVWTDANGNGITDAGELSSLSDKQIASISLSYDTSLVQQNGNVLQGASTFTTTDGVNHQVVDAGLRMAPSVMTLSHGESLDLSSAINLASLEQVDMAADANANSVVLTLNDVLGVATTNGLHTLTLTGDANDSVQLLSHEWVNTGHTVIEGDRTYAVYNAHASSAAQLLIDQAMAHQAVYPS